MPKPGYSAEENRKYDEFLEKLKGKDGKRPSPEKVVDVLLNTPFDVREENDKRGRTPINDARNDFFEELLVPGKGKTFTEDDYKYAVEINRLLTKNYIEKKVRHYRQVQEVKEDVKNYKYPGTEWLVFPEDEKKATKVAENVAFMIDPKPFEELTNAQMLRDSFQQFGNYAYYEGPRQKKVDHKPTKVKEKATIYSCFFDDDSIRVDEYYRALGITDTMESSKIEADYMNYDLGKIEGVEFNKNYKPGDPVITKYPEEYAKMLNMKSKEDMQRHFNQLNSQYRAAEEYEKSAFEVKKQAEELFQTLKDCENDFDGEHSYEYYKMEDELKNITKLGNTDPKDGMVIMPKSSSMMEVKTNYIEQVGINTVLDRLFESAKAYEDTHKKNALSPMKYQRGMLDISKQLQTFATLAKEKMDVRNYPGMTKTEKTKQLKESVEKQLARGKVYAERKFGSSKFRTPERTHTEITQKLKLALDHADKATQNVHFGSSQYRDASNSLKDAVNDYRRFTEGYMDPSSAETDGKKLTKEELVVSLTKAKHDINKYIEYKRKNGYIAEGKVAAPKTEKRIQAMQESLKTVELALKTLNSVVKEMDVQRVENTKKVYGDLEKSFMAEPAPQKNDNIINLNDSNFPLGLNDDESELEIDTSSAKKPGKAEENDLPEDVADAVDKIGKGEEKLSEIVSSADSGRFEQELKTQIDSRRKVVEYSLGQGEPSAEMKEKASEEIEDLVAGMITAKTYLTRSKKDPSIVQKLNNELMNRPDKEKGFNFGEEVKKLKESTQFRNFAASKGKDLWENAKALGEMAMTNNGDKLYGEYAKHSAKKLSPNAEEIMNTKLMSRNKNTEINKNVKTI